MSQQHFQQSDNHIFLTFVASGTEDPAMIDEVSYQTVKRLTDAHYQIKPIYTGAMHGGTEFEALPMVAIAARHLWDNKEFFIEVIKGLKPLLEQICNVRSELVKKAVLPEQGYEVKVTVESASMEIKGPDAQEVEQLTRLAHEIWLTHPSLATSFTPQSPVTITTSVPPRNTLPHR